MLTDYTNIFKIFLPMYIFLFILCWKCMLSPRMVSILLFFLLTLPVLSLLFFILYQSINNTVDDVNEKDCKKDVKYNLFCNSWDTMENKCYRGIYNNNKCNRDILKNIPKDLYYVSAIIIIANLFFAIVKIDCK